MKNFLKFLLALTCFFSSTSLLAFANTSVIPNNQTKLYFDTNDLEIFNNVMYIHLSNNLFETNAIRSDQQGLYIFEDDLMYGTATEKQWKCPYCHYWWPVGQKCKNPDCPTNQW